LKIILKQSSPKLGLSVFDVLVHKKLLSKYEHLREELYQVDCHEVQKFLSENPDFVYLGSEDLAHVLQRNLGIVEFIKELEKDGFIIVCLDHALFRAWDPETGRSVILLDR